MKGNRVCDLLGIRYPIIEGGLAYLGWAELAAAVSNAGALGQLTAGHMDADTLKQEIRRVRTLTDRPFGVSVAVGAREEAARKLETVLDEGVRIVSLSGGNPIPYIEHLKAFPGVRVIAVISTVAHARKAEDAGADIVVAEGFEAGGHNGSNELTTFALVPQVASAVKIPVVAAGGIVNGRGMVAALALGASGVQMGTRFVMTRECIAHENYKRAIMRAGDTATVVIERSIGRVTRVLDTSYAREVLEQEKRGISLAELLPLMAGEKNRVAAVLGQLDKGYAYCGQAGGLISDVLSVSEAIESIMDEARAVKNNLPLFDPVS